VPRQELTQPRPEEDLTMSDLTSAPGHPGSQPGGQPDVTDDDRDAAALMRAVLREQEKHREGGVDPELAAPGADPEPAAPGVNPEPAGPGADPGRVRPGAAPKPAGPGEDPEHHRM
jgi:hypothetical protein